MDYRLTITLTVCDDDQGGSIQRAALLAQQIVGSMYVPYGMTPPAYKDARIVVEPAIVTDSRSSIAEVRRNAGLDRWAKATAKTGPPCTDCGHRKVMHDLGTLHVDDRALTSIVDCLECYIDATRNPETCGTSGRCHGYQ